MFEKAEEAIDALRIVGSYRSSHSQAAHLKIHGLCQSISLVSKIRFSLVTWEHGIVSVQQIVFSQKQDAYGEEAPWTDLRESGSKLEIFSLFKVSFFGCFFFIFAPKYAIIAYKFCSVSKRLVFLWRLT
jgi:hypothetical protein